LRARDGGWQMELSSFLCCCGSCFFFLFWSLLLWLDRFVGQAPEFSPLRTAKRTSARAAPGVESGQEVVQLDRRGA